MRFEKCHKSVQAGKGLHRIGPRQYIHRHRNAGNGDRAWLDCALVLCRPDAMTQGSFDPAARRREQAATAVRTAVDERSNHGGAAPAARGLTRASGKVNPTAVAFSVFTKLLHTDGVRAALYSLLRLTDYRFISIFRFQDGMATSAVHVDREDLSVQQASEVPDTATYCCYVRDGNGAFVTADALTDSRTTNHAAREAVRAYCGIPIMDPEGVLIGTLCHYDLAPRDPEQLDLELLLQAASALSAPGVVPPYPTSH